MGGGRSKDAAQRLSAAWVRVSQDIWQADPKARPRARNLALCALRFVYIWIHEILRRRLLVHASALTRTTLLSLLPLVAVAIVVVKSSGLVDEAVLLATIAERFPEFTPLTTRIFDSLRDTDFASLGIAGLVFLGGAILSLFTNIEAALNEVWGQRMRHYGRRILAYSATLFLVGLVFLIAWALQIVSTDLVSQHIPFLSAAITDSLAYRFVTTVFLTLGFGLLFKVMPNTRVPTWSSLLAGFFCAGGYELSSAAYFGLQIGVANYSLFYSSLAALPITIIWIDIIWLLVLAMGALSHLLPEFTHYSKEAIEDVPAASYMDELALNLALELARERQKNGQSTRGLCVFKLAQRLQRPTPLVSGLLDRFSERGFVGEVKRGEYRLNHPNWPALRLQEVLDALRHDESKPRKAGGDPAGFRGYVQHTHEILRADGQNVTLGEVLARAPEKSHHAESPA